MKAGRDLIRMATVRKLTPSDRGGGRAPVAILRRTPDWKKSLGTDDSIVDIQEAARTADTESIK